ncbi:tripartite tricarboxylate transporter TctB family protein [Faunimonas sp. B44]|uniref:tripartite tricarboxylate transporter TctB family protein n=1 Tax=Faunimonas sp. B44 TaxID=3461493 RepID=UPI004043C78D
MTITGEPAAHPTEDQPSAEADPRPRRTGVAAGAVFVSIAVLAGYSLSSNPYLSLGASGSDPGPAFVPWIAVWILGLGGLCQIGWTFWQGRRAGGLASAGEFTVARMWLPILLFASLLGYVVLMLRPLGFMLSSSIFAAAWVAVLHWRSGDRLRPIHIVQLPLEAALIVGAIYAVFRYAILVPLP